MGYSARERRLSEAEAPTFGFHCDVVDAGQVLQAQDGVSPPHEHVRVLRPHTFVLDGWVSLVLVFMSVSQFRVSTYVCTFVDVCGRMRVRLCMFVFVRARFCTFARVLVRLYACFCLLVCTCV